MEYRYLGRSGLRVSSLILGTMTFGGDGAFASTGSTDVTGAGRQIDMCIDAGVNMLDTADIYSAGKSEEIIGEVLDDARRRRIMLATKARFPTGDRGVNERGLSRQHLIRACEDRCATSKCCTTSWRNWSPSPRHGASPRRKWR